MHHCRCYPAIAAAAAAASAADANVVRAVHERTRVGYLIA
jgi:hypothetical protein